MASERLLATPVRRLDGSGRRHVDALARSEERLRNAIEASPDGYWLLDGHGRLIDVNSAYCRLSGFSRTELLAMTVADLDAGETPEETARHLGRIAVAGHDRFETIHRRKNGSLWRVGVNAAYRDQDDGLFFVFLRDIEERARRDTVTATRLKITEIALTGTIDDLLQATLDAAEAFTGSTIGFFHFVDADQQTLTLQTWSTHTLQRMCNAEGHGLHYSIDDAGVWTDCIRRRAPVIHNDYEALTHKRGMPKGHATVVRELTVPVFRGDLVSAVVGVGNKPIAYDDADVKFVAELAAMTMEVVERKRAESRLRRTEESLRQAQAVAHVGSWTLDPRSLRLEWSDETYRIFGVPPATPVDLPTFLNQVVPEDREMITARHPRLIADAGGDGDVDYRIVTPRGLRWIHERAEIRRDEAGEVVSVVGVVQDISERKRAEAEIVQLANFDPLTGLPNRHQFGMRLNDAVAKAARHNKRMAVLQIDLDLFKNVNDGFGHEVGDRLLGEVAQRLRQRLRREDLMARLGGDEFAVLLDEIDEPADAAILARDLIESLARPFALDTVGDVAVAASIGLTVYPDDARDPVALLRNADAAVYLAKAQGRNTFRFYTESLTRAAQERITLETRLRKAVDAGHFVLHYQPLVSADTRAIIGAEALVRWNDPHEGLIPPGRFIPLAEDCGLIAPLGEFVLHEACRQMHRWLEGGRTLRTIAVNLSPRQFEMQDVVAVVARALAEAALEPAYLELEITESTLMAHGERAIATLNQLKRLGVRLSIDDFGTGYSSLSYLKRFPIDKLKIDQSFVRDLTTDAGGAQIAATIIAMGRSLKLSVLAEGVETGEQLAALEQWSCDYYQGFLFSRPVPAVDFPERCR